MSDTSQGPGWWVASDGKWYPPQEETPASASDQTHVEGESPPPWWKKPVPLWAVLLIAVVSLGLGASTATDADADADDEDAATAVPTSTVGEPDAGERTTTTTAPRRTTTTAEPTTTTTTAPTTTTTTAPPRPGFDGGTQVVGTDMEPGLYVATDVDSCYWERLSGLSGEFGDILANDNVTGQAIVEVAASDVAFSSQRCGRWELYEAPPSPADSFGDGDWVVGEQIQPGRYQAQVGSWCYWERSSGFAHGFAEILANDNVQDGNAIVEIAPGDRRFTSSGCGTWTRQQ